MGGRAAAEEGKAPPRSGLRAYGLSSCRQAGLVCGQTVLL